MCQNGNTGHGEIAGLMCYYGCFSKILIDCSSWLPNNVCKLVEFIFHLLALTSLYKQVPSMVIHQGTTFWTPGMSRIMHSNSLVSPHKSMLLDGYSESLSNCF